MSKRRILDIIVQARHRRDLGDIAGLAASIRDVGLLHPIVIRPDGVLIAGERRLAAAKQLGWESIPVTVVDMADVVRGELSENTVRKDFTPSELVAIGAAVEELERAKAKARQTANLKRGRHAPVVETSHDGGKTRDKIAAYGGVSGKTYERAKDIVEAARRDPETFGKLQEAMDRTGHVTGLWKRLRVIEKSRVIRAEPPPLPGKGPYRVIAADPPWPYEIRQEDPSHRVAYPYPMMSIDEICAMGAAVRAIAHDDCVLWLWTTNAHMREAFRVLDAWQFTQKTILTWVKPNIGNGDYLRSQTEHCLMAIRGKPTLCVINQSSALFGPKAERLHSSKPVAFYELVESVCPAPRYAALFHRGARPNWDGHGDEAAA